MARTGRLADGADVGPSGQRSPSVLQRELRAVRRVGAVAPRPERDLQSGGDQRLSAALAPHSDEAERLRAAIADSAAKMPSTLQTILPYGALHEKILALNVPVLHASGVTQPRLWQNNRWDPLALTALPPSGAETSVLSLDLMRGEVRGEVLNLTNPHDRTLPFTLRLEGLPAALNLELREVVPTDTQSRTPVMAALRPLVPDAQGRCTLNVPAGCTRQVWLSCRRPAASPGVHEDVCWSKRRPWRSGAA